MYDDLYISPQVLSELSSIDLEIKAGLEHLSALQEKRIAILSECSISQSQSSSHTISPFPQVPCFRTRPHLFSEIQIQAFIRVLFDYSFLPDFKTYEDARLELEPRFSSEIKFIRVKKIRFSGTAARFVRVFGLLQTKKAINCKLEETLPLHFVTKENDPLLEKTVKKNCKGNRSGDRYLEEGLRDDLLRIFSK